jgi:hypothetical protein
MPTTYSSLSPDASSGDPSSAPMGGGAWQPDLLSSLLQRATYGPSPTVNLAQTPRSLYGDPAAPPTRIPVPGGPNPPPPSSMDPQQASRLAALHEHISALEPMIRGLEQSQRTSYPGQGPSQGSIDHYRRDLANSIAQARQMQGLSPNVDIAAPSSRRVSLDVGGTPDAVNHPLLYSSTPVQTLRWTAQDLAKDEQLTKQLEILSDTLDAAKASGSPRAIAYAQANFDQAHTAWLATPLGRWRAANAAKQSADTVAPIVPGQSDINALAQAQKRGLWGQLLYTLPLLNLDASSEIRSQAVQSLTSMLGGKAANALDHSPSLFSIGDRALGGPVAQQVGHLAGGLLNTPLEFSNSLLNTMSNHSTPAQRIGGGADVASWFLGDALLEPAVASAKSLWYSALDKAEVGDTGPLLKAIQGLSQAHVSLKDMLLNSPGSTHDSVAEMYGRAKGNSVADASHEQGALTSDSLATGKPNSESAFDSFVSRLSSDSTKEPVGDLTKSPISNSQDEGLRFYQPGTNKDPVALARSPDNDRQTFVDFLKNEWQKTQDDEVRPFYNESSYRITKNIVESLPESVFRDLSMEFHPEIPPSDKMSLTQGRYVRDFALIQIARNLGERFSFMSAKSPVALVREAPLVIAEEIGHHLEHFILPHEYEDLIDQYIAEKASAARPNDYRWSNFSEWFAHKFADDVVNQYSTREGLGGNGFASKSIIRLRGVGAELLEAIQRAVNPKPTDPFQEVQRKLIEGAGRNYIGQNGLGRLGIYDNKKALMDALDRWAGKESRNLVPPSEIKPLSERQIPTWPAN